MGILSTLFAKREKSSLCRLISPRPADGLGAWAPAFPNFSEVVGYSSLGHFFLRDPDSLEYIVLYPFRMAAKSYGSHASVRALEEAVLREPGFQANVLTPEHVDRIFSRLGDLVDDQDYIPRPFPFLGGAARILRRMTRAMSGYS